MMGIPVLPATCCHGGEHQRIEKVREDSGKKGEGEARKSGRRYDAQQCSPEGGAVAAQATSQEEEQRNLERGE